MYLLIIFQDGAILVFVPGWSEISDLNKKLTNDRAFGSGEFLHCVQMIGHLVQVSSYTVYKW